MNFLYEKIATLKEAGISETIPQFLIDNISTNIKLRDYQEEAIKDTLIYLNSNLSKNKQTHILYHMATGSGKTVIMALNILYYYSQGYRNFLFFTNQTNIISKTKINFLDKTSSKYLFANNINIAGKNVKIREVSNFEDSDPNAINICFNTVQGIHSSLILIREGALTIEDFENEKIVLIADEAHHLNSTTASDKEENENNATWESTVYNLLLANKENVLLEYTATCDVQDVNVRNKYLDKIVFNFDLKEFRKAGYTKEFVNMRSNTTKWERTLQAILVSEYRKLIFEQNNITIKPVVLLKSKTIKESNEFYNEFYEQLIDLQPSAVEFIKNANQGNSLLSNAFDFFESIDLSMEELVDLIKVDFAIDNSVNMNELNPKNESIVNNLDEKDNHYRIVFIVDKLTEGWDVLSLYDIVRLYETRQGGSKGTVSKYTISEAQLIGRGARYCPFKFEEDQVKEKRKYSDYNNPLSICETLIYHCMDDSKYIDEIKKALKQTGLLPEIDTVQVTYKLKDDFKNTEIYQKGFVFLNNRIEIDRSNVKSIPEKVRSMGISYKCRNSYSSTGALFEEGNGGIKFKDLTPIKISDIAYNIAYKAYRCFNETLSFDKLKKQFPNLESVNEFITSDEYVGSFPITFLVIENTEPSIDDKLEACKKVFQIISDYVQTIEITFEGTKEFYAKPIRDVFTNKIRNITREANDESWGAGISQNDSLVNDTYRMDLSDKSWFAYNDNYGTSEEKKFVKYFSTIVEKIKNKFEDVYLIRNEIQACIYSFEDGSKFEPDYVLILNKHQENKEKDNLYICMFIEPKGEHLLEKDSWKNTLLLDLKEKGIPIVKFVDDNEYRIWGSPLYNEANTKEDFNNYLEELLNTVN
jgi:type III site-specific deoxyribonuclease